MKYDIEIDAEESTSSHALVLDLVGGGKRVLDVGCATGYLAKVLGERSNKVSGVEVDPESAEQARPYLERLVVADLDNVDLSAELAGEQFDVIVFADVLEHLKDPASTLRQARSLLGEGGYAVISIPNVAHGAVRLSLLQGDFQYRSLGLLDDTHIRFFTRSGVEDLLRSAGYAAVDVRRTTASPFETEIPVSPGDVPAEAVSLVASDPDSTTYQFVFSAVPLGPGNEKAMEVLAARDREIALLRRSVADIARSFDAVVPVPTVGVLDGGSATLAAFDQLRVAVYLAELRRRIAGVEVRAYSLAEAPGVAFDGEPLYPVHPRHPDRMAELAGRLASMVMSGAPATTAAMATGLEAAEVPVRRLEDPAFGDPPELLALAAALFDATFLQRRVQYLRVTEAVPALGDFALGYLRGPGGDVHAGAIESIARLRGLDSVRLPADCHPLDLLGMVAASAVVVTDYPHLAALATGLGRPTIVAAQPASAAASWAEALGLPTGFGSKLVSLAGDVDAGDPGPPREVLLRVAGTAFDELAGPLLSALAPKLGATARERVDELVRRVEVLEAVNDGLRRALSHERASAAARMAQLALPDDEQALDLAGSPRRPFAPRAAEATAATEAQLAELRAEIQRIYSTKLMRTAKPLRSLYARLRSVAR
jgi:2-polyprenyl-3-methyl-5-hydroxy-6-metoxy-1,4-benzoquinol methylase